MRPSVEAGMGINRIYLTPDGKVALNWVQQMAGGR
jgi:hypothetical protein